MEEQQGQQGQQVSNTLPTDVLAGMQAVGDAIAQAGAPQEVLQMLSQAMQLYEQVLQAMSGGGSQQQGRPQPMQQQGQPMSPAGV